MKKRSEKKLNLSKITIRDLQPNLERDQQQVIKGGSVEAIRGTTNIPVLCIP